MDRQKLYDCTGKFTGKYIKRKESIALGVDYHRLIVTANKEGYFVKEQLKNLKPGQVIECKS